LNKAALATCAELRHIAGMTYLARNTLWKLIQGVVISALLVRAAYAQFPMPGITLNPGEDSRPLTKEEAEKKQAREDAYKATLEKIPNKENKKPVDPWGNMRSATPNGQQ
jgi:hypothetical protein